MEQVLHQIIAQAKQGDKDAFAFLVERYKGHVYRHAFAMIGERMAAEDVAQEAFIKAYYSLEKLESGFAFSAWLTRIVSRLCYDQLKKRNKERSIGEQLAVNLGSSDSMNSGQFRISIEEALIKLTPEHREAVILRDIQGYTYEEIAHILNIPLGTVKSRINAARLALRQEIRKGEEEII